MGLDLDSASLRASQLGKRAREIEGREQMRGNSNGPARLVRVYACVMAASTRRAGGCVDGGDKARTANYTGQPCANE